MGLPSDHVDCDWGTWQVVVDRWEMTVTTGQGRSEKSKVTTFNNYFGIGVDAQVHAPCVDL